jgi:glycosyltransferase involved in cell wall biosynthesis
MSARPRVVVLRGHSANVADLRPWELLRDRFDVVVLTTRRADQSIEGLEVPWRTVRSRRDLLPRGRLGGLAAMAAGDGYRGLERELAGAAIVHTAELAPWFAAQPARLRGALGFRLVVTVWETIPFLDAFRTFRARSNRALVLREADLFLAVTERARRGLLLEGASAERIAVSPPGIDLERFRAAREKPGAGAEHVVVSPGRLVWEKGHYDVLRAVAVVGPACRLVVVGAGPERERLARYARELGIGHRVEIRSAAYGEMPALFGRASCVVLASLPIPTWEEQFGMVLSEAMAAGAPILASASGAIPEVLEGSGATLFAPGDWIGLARLLEDGPLAHPPGTPARYPDELLRRYSLEGAAERLANAYDRVLA